jgi:hypothetical protein
MKLCLELLETRCVPSTVTNLSDHDPGSLRDAIATTPDGGTVDFQPGLTGTIVLTSGELAINKDLTIEGPGADLITVSGNKASRVFNIAKFTVAISGLTIADGSARFGGGIYNAGTLILSHSNFAHNIASGWVIRDHGLLFFDGAGGGLCNAGTLTITGCTFSGNAARPYADGGGIANGGRLAVTGSTFSGNSAGTGGGICNQAGTVTVADSTFSGNSAGTGRGISIHYPHFVKIRNTLLAGNSS